MNLSVIGPFATTVLFRASCTNGFRIFSSGIGNFPISRGICCQYLGTDPEDEEICLELHRIGILADYYLWNVLHNSYSEGFASERLGGSQSGEGVQHIKSLYYARSKRLA
jgi:hypothetical protein